MDRARFLLFCAFIPRYLCILPLSLAGWPPLKQIPTVSGPYSQPVPVLRRSAASSEIARSVNECVAMRSTIGFENPPNLRRCIVSRSTRSAGSAADHSQHRHVSLLSPACQMSLNLGDSHDALCGRSRTAAIRYSNP
jgi:hypothetical protein